MVFNAIFPKIYEPSVLNCKYTGSSHDMENLHVAHNGIVFGECHVHFFLRLDLKEFFEKE